MAMVARYNPCGQASAGRQFDIATAWRKLGQTRDIGNRHMNDKANSKANSKASSTDEAGETGEIGRLQALLRAQHQSGAPENGSSRRALTPAPVHLWNPPDRGDIGMHITSDGRWHYQGSEIRRPELVRLFASVLRRDPDGITRLVTPVEMVHVKVDDAPFIAVELECTGQGREQMLLVRTNLDEVVALGPEHPLRMTMDPVNGGLIPYVMLRHGLEARFTRSLAYDLALLALENDTGATVWPQRKRPDEANACRPGIWSGGEFFALPEQGTEL